MQNKMSDGKDSFSSYKGRYSFQLDPRISPYVLSRELCEFRLLASTSGDRQKQKKKNRPCEFAAQPFSILNKKKRIVSVWVHPVHT